MMHVRCLPPHSPSPSSAATPSPRRTTLPVTAVVWGMLVVLWVGAGPVSGMMAPAPCAYSSVGFNPWEIWHAFGSAGTSNIEATAVEGRVAGHNVIVESNGIAHTRALPGDDVYNAVTASGTLEVRNTDRAIQNGRIEAVGDITVAVAAHLTVPVQSTSGSIALIESGRVTGDVKAGGSISLQGGSSIAGNAQTNGDFLMGGGSSGSGTVAARGDFSISDGARFSGNVQAGGDLTLEPGTGILGNVVSSGHLELGPGTRVTGTSLSQSINVHTLSGSEVEGGSTIGSPPKPQLLNLATSVDLAPAAKYFQGRSEKWASEPNSVLSYRVARDAVNPAKRILHIELHGRVNYLTVTQEEIEYVFSVFLTGDSNGVLILNVKGTNVKLKETAFRFVGPNGLQFPTAGRIVVNFYEATAVDLKYFHGTIINTPSGPNVVSILAPKAHIESEAVEITGSVIGKSYRICCGSRLLWGPFGEGLYTTTSGTQSLFKMPVTPFAVKHWAFIARSAPTCLWRAL